MIFFQKRTGLNVVIDVKFKKVVTPLLAFLYYQEKGSLDASKLIAGTPLLFLKVYVEGGSQFFHKMWRLSKNGEISLISILSNPF